MLNPQKLQAIANPDHEILFRDAGLPRATALLRGCLEYYPQFRVGVAHLVAHPFVTGHDSVSGQDCTSLPKFPFMFLISRQQPHVRVTQDELASAMAEVTQLPAATPAVVSRRVFNRVFNMHAAVAVLAFYLCRDH